MRRLRSERGGVYLEALIALAILALALIPILTTLIVTPASQRDAGERMAALNLARAQLETLKLYPPDDWDGLDTTETVGGVEYSIDVGPKEETGVEGLYTARVTVSWSGGSVSLTTQIAGGP
ncbi:hypothetical protein [Symbiobacterium terraclitae]|uniref:hypothetical protein n=1 Tax=Symbiobacterium terraclitae TaxID=557451 RepID=UPI0035B51A7D